LSISRDIHERKKENFIFKIYHLPINKNFLQADPHETVESFNKISFER